MEGSVTLPGRCRAEALKKLTVQFCKPLLKRRHKVEDVFEELKGGSPIAGK